jgi:hypothetical protein
MSGCGSVSGRKKGSIGGEVDGIKNEGTGGVW